MTVVKSIISTCKDTYGNRFDFYLAGSVARNEQTFEDYDILIYDNDENKNTWKPLLRMFDNKVEADGKPIDAQIDQLLPILSRMSGEEIFIRRDKIVKRYFYKDGQVLMKEVPLVRQKHRDMGLDKIKRVYRKL